MHSKDPGKRAGALYSTFFLEFKSILATAAQGTADFSKFVFPHHSLRSIDIESHCIFKEAVFEEDLDLYKVRFKRSVDFSEATFEQKLTCIESVVFSGKADFVATNFRGRASFRNAIFHEDADFSGSTFEESYFTGTHFKGHATFSMVNFQGRAEFPEAVFSESATFLGSHFVERHYFRNTSFEKEANLSGVTFHKEVHFYQRTKFQGYVFFVQATFAGEAQFWNMKFSGEANFNSAKFLDAAHFGSGLFRSDETLKPGPIFLLTHFSKEGAIFDKTDLSHALFHGCDISNVTFSSVTWPRRPHNGNLMVFEEIVSLSEDPTLRRFNGERDYGLIAQLYQRLKKNYDESLAYWDADQFHYGEMEMQRLAVPTSGPLLKLRAFYHRHLSLIAWYRRGSNYGNSYLRPIVWLCGILLLFALLFPVTGLQRTSAGTGAASSRPVTYSSVWVSANSLRDNIWGELKLIGKSSLTAIDTATFQKASEYIPTYPYGRALAILESLLTATVFALFLLAVRRQFRR
jgi:uncharacterized protein YjbI with pentapeptide repeats